MERLQPSTRGGLRPLRPLVLPEHTRVQLRVVKQTPAAEPDRDRTIQALLSTGRVKRLGVPLVEDTMLGDERQTPPTLPGISLSDTIIAQRRGEL
jgi:hypothetical protein